MQLNLLIYTMHMLALGEIPYTAQHGIEKLSDHCYVQRKESIDAFEFSLEDRRQNWVTKWCETGFHEHV